MYSETTIIGYVSQAPETGTTKNGVHSVKTRVETAEVKGDGRPWRNWIPVWSFGTAANRLGELDEGDCVVLKGRLVWQSETNGLVVIAREVSKFAFVPYGQAEAATDA